METKAINLGGMDAKLVEEIDKIAWENHRTRKGEITIAIKNHIKSNKDLLND